MRTQTQNKKNRGPPNFGGSHDVWQEQETFQESTRPRGNKFALPTVATIWRAVAQSTHEKQYLIQPNPVTG